MIKKWWFVALLAVLAALIPLVYGEATNHSEYHKALEANINRALEPYGIQCTVTRKGYYISDSDEQGAFIEQSLIRTECEGAEPAQYTWLASWPTPTTRKDGAQLHLHEIQGYEFQYRPTNGEWVSVTLDAVNAYKFTLPSGEARVKTIDTDGRIAEEWSPTATF